MAIACALLLTLCLLHGAARAQGSVLLVGGGSEEYDDWSDRPYRWLVEQAPNRTILILHYATASSWLPGYFRSLGADSATNLVIPTSLAANDSANVRAILNADGIFLRGGDQWEYVRLWNGTLVEEAIREVYRRGGVVGGTSAGLSVLTDPVFDARTVSVNPRVALQSPLAAGITFTTGFLSLVPNVLGDTHFFERGRLGRLAPMVAVRKVSSGANVAGIGVDYNTALAIRPDNTAEVMGAGTVTLLRLTPATSITVATAVPFSTRDMLLDQLTDGFVVNLATWEITPSAAATPFTAVHAGAPVTHLVVDGSATQAYWFAPGGSVTTFLARLAAGSVVCVLASPASTSSANAVAAELSSRGYQPRVLLLDAAAPMRPGAADTIAASAGFVLAGNEEESLAAYLGGSSPVGSAFIAAVTSGAPVLALANDGKLLSREAVVGVESHEYAAYYGMMRRVRGLGLADDVQIMTRLFETSSFIDNRASGLFWGLAGAAQPFGILIDNGAFVEILPEGILRAHGSTPVMVVDARRSTYAAFPSWIDPGRTDPRQNAAVIGARLHVVSNGQELELTSLQAVADPPPLLPGSIALLPPYPNPCNARATVILLLESRRRCTVTVHDILGRQAAVLALDEELGPGRIALTWDAANEASGTYFVRLRSEGAAAAAPVHLIR